MVGVPRSNGCALCLNRRVKCDEVKPACGNCLKYGADCPGYDKSRKFVIGKHVIRKKRHASKSIEAPPSIAEGSGSDSSHTILRRHMQGPNANPSQNSRLSPLPTSIAPNRGQFIVTLMQVLRNTH